MKGSLEVKAGFSNLRKNLQQTGYQIQDLLRIMEKRAIKQDLLQQEKQHFEELKKFLIKEE